MIEFKLNQDYIELNKLLKTLDFFSSGGEAKMLIKEKQIILNGEVETKLRAKLRVNDIVQFGQNQIKIL